MSETDWGRFRIETISLTTFVKRTLIHVDLLTEAARRAGSGGVLEVGLGSGAQSAALSRRIRRVASVERDPRILEAARPNVHRFGSDLLLVAGDAFALPFRDQMFGVAISQGLMEHFSDDEIADLLREQLRVCRSVVFSVPSDRYPRQDVGDERLMSPDRWRRIVEDRVDGTRHRVTARYYRFDPESLKYSMLARRRLGGFSVLVIVDPR